VAGAISQITLKPGGYPSIVLGVLSKNTNLQDHSVVTSDGRPVKVSEIKMLHPHEQPVAQPRPLRAKAGHDWQDARHRVECQSCKRVWASTPDVPRHILRQRGLIP